ncbi:hypothetical protein JXO52_02860 [bacterium]|nr:hypothetical protein [bacterium]
MEQIYVLFSRRDVTAVADAVVGQGKLQIVDAAELEQWAGHLEKGTADETSRALQERQDQVLQLFRGLRIDEGLADVQPAEGGLPDLESRLQRIQSRLEHLLKEEDEAARELGEARELLARTGDLSGLDVTLAREGGYEYLAVETGRIAEENLEILRTRLQPFLHILAPLGTSGGQVTLMVIALKRDQGKLAKALRDSGFSRLDLGKAPAVLSPQWLDTLRKRETEARQKLDDLLETKKRLRADESQFLKSLLYRIRRDRMKSQILTYFRRTESTFLLSGWIPSRDKASFVTAVKRATKNRCIIEEHAADTLAAVRNGSVEVPVQMRNPLLLRPFELLTTAYGIPSYRTIDPTPVMAVSFLFMFGMMFGDAGHGLVLALAGLLLAGRRRAGQTMRQAGLLLLYAGLSSILFGLLFGSVFGVETWLRPLWVRPMDSITYLFRIVIYFGMGMIFLSIGINIINGIRTRDIAGCIFDKAGLLAGVLYWCGIVLVTRLLAGRAEAAGEVPALPVVLMIGSLVLLFLREPIMQLFKGKKELFPEGAASGIMGGLVELLEISLGFLSNTVSFIRVAAFGLAHAGLFMAIFALSDSAKTVAGGVASGVILIFGNILIILLEGLVVSIQAVRLEFYEFFSRFFSPGGSAYRPLNQELVSGPRH